MKKLKTFVAAAIGLMLFTGAAQACPTCKEAISENGGNLVQGYFWSIIFMMSMPFTILGGLITKFYFDVRRARRESEVADECVKLPHMWRWPSRLNATM